MPPPWRRAARCGDQPVGEDRSVGEQLDRALEVAPTVDPGADDPQLPLEDPMQVDGLRLRMDGHDDHCARTRTDRWRREPRRPSWRPRTPRPPQRHRSSHPPMRDVVGHRIEDVEAESLDRLPAAGISSHDDHVATLVPDHGSDPSMPIGPPPMTTARSPGVQVGATNVMDRDRGRFDESGMARAGRREARPAGRRGRSRGAAGRPERSTRSPRGDGRRARCRLGRPGRCRPRSAARP